MASVPVPAPLDASAVVCRGLTKDYGQGHGLFDLDLDITRGEVFGFVGPNGAGKTTTIRLLMDLIRPDRGTATVLGLDSRRDSRAIKRRVGYLPGELPAFPGVSAGYVVGLLAGLRGGVDRARIAALAERLDLDLGQRYQSLSHGNKQKVHLVQAFMHGPEVLILDEPSLGLDPLVQREFRALVAEAAAGGATVLLSSHVLAEVELICDRIGLIREGRLLRVGSMDQLRTVRAHRVEALVRNPGEPRDLAAVPGVSDAAVGGRLATRPRFAGPGAGRSTSPGAHTPWSLGPPHVSRAPLGHVEPARRNGSTSVERSFRQRGRAVKADRARGAKVRPAVTDRSPGLMRRAEGGPHSERVRRRTASGLTGSRSSRHHCSMVTESNGVKPLEWRAAGHAALSDVGRLRVIDSLEVGDVSPRDLAATLGMSSNLLAHHLKVLEAAGLVRRLPSESDGRRIYVRLVPEALAALGRFPTPPLPIGRVVFVCSGNSARSQLAAALWANRTGRPVSSAGTRPAARIHPGTVRVARRHGLPLLADRPASTAEVLAGDDVIITVCDSADREVTTRHTHWSIPDPVPVGTPAAFEQTLADLANRIDGWVQATAEHPRQAAGRRASRPRQA